MRTVRAAMAGLVALTALAAAGPASAHPHVYIDVRVAVHFDADGNITHLEQTWLMDQLYSAFIIDGMDRDGDGAPDQAELDGFMEEILGNLAEYDYFTDITGFNGDIPIGQVRGDAISFDSPHVQVSFTTPLSTPVNPASGDLVYAVYDPTYYIDMLHAEGGEPIRLVNAPAGCTHRVIDPTPDQESVDLAASLDQTQTAGNTLGILFAEKVVISCQPVG